MIKLVKLFKITSLFLTIGSMVVSVFAYSFFKGPWFAIGFVALLFIHEMGHVAALRLRGYNTPGPVFIPFLGAAVFVPKFNDKKDEAFVGYGGPLLGTAASIATYLLWMVWPGNPQLLLLLSYVSAFINLFNLIPMRPLDGGRVTQIVGDWVKYIGLAVVIVFVVAAKNPGMIVLIILILGDSGVNRSFRIGAGLLLQTVMMALIFSGLGDAHPWANWVDIFLASTLNLVNFSRNNPAPDEIADPLTETTDKAFWLIAYFGLVVVLLWLMNNQLPHLKGILE